MAERVLTAQEEIAQQGKRAKEEHAAKHGDDSPTSAAATAEGCAELGKALGFGTYASDETVEPKAKVQAEDKAVKGPKE